MSGGQSTVLLDSRIHVDRHLLNGTGRTEIFTNSTGVVESKALTIDGTNGYTAIFNNRRTVIRFDLDGSGGFDELFEHGLSFPSGIVKTDTYFYIADRSTNHVFRFNLDGTGKTDLIDLGFQPTGLSTDGVYLYTTNNLTEVIRFSLDGTGRTDLFESERYEQGLPHSFFSNGVDFYVVGYNNLLDRYDSAGNATRLFNLFDLLPLIDGSWGVEFGTSLKIRDGFEEHAFNSETRYSDSFNLDREGIGILPEQMPAIRNVNSNEIADQNFGIDSGNIGFDLGENKILVKVDGYWFTVEA